MIWSWDKEAAKHLRDFYKTVVLDFFIGTLADRAETFPPELARAVDDIENDLWLAYLDTFIYYLDGLNEAYAQYVSTLYPRAYDISPYMPTIPSTNLIRPAKPFNKMKLNEVANYIRNIGKFMKEFYEEGWDEALEKVTRYLNVAELVEYTKRADVYAEQAAKNVENLAKHLADYLKNGQPKL